MPFENIPGIFNDKLDGNLTIPNTNDAPIVAVLGTASQGDADNLYNVVRITDAASTFGSNGTLVRGMYEVSATGASNIRLLRIGATAARLAGIAGGIIDIETIEKDGSAGDNYKVHYIASTGRVKVFRVSDDTLVYDSGTSGDPSTKVDLGEVSVTISGTPAGSDIGLTSGDPEDSAVVLSSVPDAASPNGDPSATFTAGDDGLTLNRMQTYEALQDAYRLLEDADLDLVVPMNVYLDDLNVRDTDSATVSGLMATVSGHSDITTGGTDDYLGLFREEEYQGRFYYWWDVDQDGVAEITPTVDGLTSGQQTLVDGGDTSIAAAVAASGADLTSADFHEVNFAYQLANFCFQSSHLNTEMTGCIGVKPPNSFSAKDVANWVGTEPTTATDSGGATTITANGTGLLGNKFVAGRIASGTIPSFRNGAVNGGFIATSSEFLDGTELTDANSNVVDIGKYIDLVSAYTTLNNPSNTSAYSTTGAPSYAGLRTRIVAGSAATNKVVPNTRLPFRLASSKVDLLAGKRFVHFVSKPKGTVVADAPTGSRPDSDYNRRSTMDIVKATIDTVRTVGEPFLGEGMSATQLAALETNISNALSDLAKNNVLNRFDLSVTATALQRIKGEASVDLVLVPAFELRRISVTVALAAT